MFDVDPCGWVWGVVAGLDASLLVDEPEASRITHRSASTATISAITENTRAVGNPPPRAAIPWASSRRVNQSSRPSSPRGGPTGATGIWGSSSRVSIRAITSKLPPFSHHPAYDDAPMPLQIIDTWTQTSNVPAVAAAVLGADGMLDSRLAGAVSSDSLFALASLTKPLVAAAAMIAVEEGALDLDTPVSEYLHTFGTDSRRLITSRHLLSHASGLPEVGPKGVASIDVEPVCPPATRRIYSNEGYAVLGGRDRRGDRHRLSPPTCARRCSSRSGMDAFLGLPESEYGRALDVRRARARGIGRRALQ